MEGDLLSNDDLLLDNLYGVSDYEMLEIGNDLASRAKQTDKTRPKNDSPLQYKMSAIEEDLLDQFDDDNVVELELGGKNNKTIPQWQLASSNDPMPTGFKEVEENIEASLGFRPDPWQIRGLLDVKQGRDTVVMAGTGLGKSLLFQALPLITKNAIVLVVMPTLALMEDQLQWMEKHGISVIALTADAIAADPEVWKKVEAGNYSVILASPKVLLQYASVFLLRTVQNRGSAFTKRLACIAVDEAHLVWGWRTFRKEYAALGVLRHCFPKAPMMALSATITPNVLGYIGQSLHFRLPTRLYKQSLDWPNITQIVTNITNPGFHDLRFLVPEAGLIPKTMLFVDKMDDAMAIAAYLCNLLPPEDRNQGEVLIRTYYSNLETKTRTDFMEDFRNRDTRILICTDAARMGVNIPNVTRVVQWKISDIVTLAVLMQRIGRAGRDPRIAAVALLLVEDCHILPEDVSTLTERIITEDDQEIVKTSPFQNKTMPVSQKNKAEVSALISTLYEDNMQIRKEKGLNAYHQIDPALLWYVNTTGCCRRLALACFMCKTAFERHLDDNVSCCDICLYKNNAKNLDNAGDEIPPFRLHGITRYLSLCYRTTEEFRLEQVRSEQEKAQKKSLNDKAAYATTQLQQESCYKELDDFAHGKWSVTMGKTLFPIKWREKLARQACRIRSIQDLEDELKPDCLLKTSILGPFAEKLVTRIKTAVLILVAQQGFLQETAPTTAIVYRDEASTPNTLATPNTSSKTSFRSPKKNNKQGAETRLPLKELAPNVQTIDMSLPQKKRGRPKKGQQSHCAGASYEIVIDLEAQELLKAQEQVQKYDSGQQAKKRKAALVQRDNGQRSKKQQQKKAVEKPK